MAKYSGLIGFSNKVEVKPGLFKPQVVTKKYIGDLTRQRRSSIASDDSPHEEIQLNLNLSVVMNKFMQENIGNIKYIEYLGSKWKVKSVDTIPPRVILSIGGLYNG